MDNNQFMYAFCMLANALGGGGNKGKAFPEDDAIDFSNGARYIPEEVTLARRRGERVVFNSQEHSWTMPDGSIVE